MPLSGDVDLAGLADASADLVGADLEAVCRKAAMKAIREFIESGRKDYSDLKVSNSHFREALGEGR
jgi:transitional endoplasmic reticulum ATPase